MDTLGKIFYVNFLGYAHCFMSIRISQLKYHCIYLDQSLYATYVVVKYLNTATIKELSKSYKTTLLSDVIFTKEDYSNSDEQV